MSRGESHSEALVFPGFRSRLRCCSYRGIWDGHAAWNGLEKGCGHRQNCAGVGTVLHFVLCSSWHDSSSTLWFVAGKYERCWSLTTLSSFQHVHADSSRAPSERTGSGGGSQLSETSQTHVRWRSGGRREGREAGVGDEGRNSLPSYERKTQ